MGEYSTTCMRVLLSKYRLAAIITVLAQAAVIFAFKLNNPLWDEDNKGIADFLYYFVYIKSFWTSSLTHIYDTETQQKILHSYFGSYLLVMPVNISPTTLLISYPLVFISKMFSDKTAYIVWIGVSLTCFSTSFFRWVNVRRDSNGRLLLLSIIVITISNFSLAMDYALIHGQTSILATALFLALHWRFSRKIESNITPTAALVLLSIKPQFFLLGFCMCIFWRRLKPAIYSLCIIVLFSILLTPYLGWNWIIEYAGSIFSYFNHLPVTYQPNRQNILIANIFRYTTEFVIDSNTARIISATVLIGGVSFIMLNSLSSHVTTSKLKFLNMAAESNTIAFFAIFLLFSPHLNIYDDLLLLLFACVYLDHIKNNISETILHITSVCFLCFYFISLNYPYIGNNATSPAASLAIFLAKVLTIGIPLFSLRHTNIPEVMSRKAQDSAFER